MAGKPSPRPSSSSADGKQRVAGGLLGLGLDGQDGHKRITQGDDFLLLGGSEETHERMQGMVIRMNEKLKRTGRRYADLSSNEFEDLARDSLR
jgi:hypothetical protein